MKTKTAISKITSLLLAFALVVGFAPLTAFAAPAAGTPLGTSGGVRYVSLGGGNARVSGYSAPLPTDLNIPSTVEFSGETYIVTEIGDNAFNGFNSLTSVIIPDTIQRIGDRAFTRCANLTSITLPHSVQTIGKLAFYECTSIDNVTIANSVTSIGDSAFYKCTSLSSITLPNALQHISAYMFYDCDSLTSITLPASLQTIGDTAFCSSGLTSIIIPSTVQSIGDSAFAYTALTSIIIPDTVQSIGVSAFEGSGLTSIVIPNSIQHLGNDMFSECYDLVSVTLPDSLQTIGDTSFLQCTSLTSIVIPESVTSIGDVAFGACTSLTSITIPNSVISIGDYALVYCDNLTTVSFNGVTPPAIGTDLFLDSPNLTTINVPAASEAAYKAALPAYASMIIGTIVAPPVDEKAITIQTDSNGTATASKTSAKAGEIITLTATPNTGYRFKEWQVVSGGVSVVNDQFTMPATAVTVKAIFELLPAGENAIIVQTDSNGTASVNKTSAKIGETITLTATPNSGYRFKEWQVVSGGVTVANNQFTMPANNIVIKAIFEVSTTPPVNPNPPTTSGGSSSGSGGGSSRADGAHPTTTTTTNRPLTKAEATKLFETALAAKPAGATTLSIKVQNKTSVTKEVLAELAALAKKNGVTLTVHFDNVVGGKVVSRLSVNPATATADLDLNITENKALAARFAKYYSNPLAAFTIKTGGSVAIPLPANLKTEGLVIYSYNTATNTYAVIPNAKPWVDKSGYLHFDIVAGTEVVISQGNLVKK